MIQLDELTLSEFVERSRHELILLRLAIGQKRNINLAIRSTLLVRNLYQRAVLEIHT